MAHLIDKDAVVAEIKRLLDKYTSVHTFNYGATQDLNHLLSFIDALKVEEPDLEKEIDLVEDKYHGFESLSREDIIEITKHFFELGLKHRKDNNL